ncbi:MAG: EAL domain-containing protein [Sideroxydans sp.]|jgi:diguanylate cyclase (GGDEF)-like protein/PAS domain S-box-containing protein
MQDSGSSQTSHADILKIVLIYAIFASLWILLSDKVVFWLSDDHEFHRTAQTLKGWLFVGTTSALLYFLLRRPFDPARTRHTTHPASLFGWKQWQTYLFAVILTLLTLLIHHDIAVPLEEHAFLILFIFPVILSAAIGGMGPGLLATLLSAVLVSYFVLPPIGSFRIERTQDLFQLGVLLVNGLLVSYLSAMLLGAYQRSEQERLNTLAHLADKEQAMQLLNSIAEGSTDAIYVQDMQGHFIFLNQAAARFIGKDIQELLGKSITDIFPPEQAAHIQDNDRRVLQDDQTITVQETAATQSGETFFSTTKGPIHDVDGKTIGLFGVARDITEHERIGATLRQQEETYRSLFDNIMNGVVYVRMIFEGGTPVDMECHSINPAFAKVSGISEPIVGRRVSEIIPGFCENNPEMLKAFGRVATGGEPTRWEQYVSELGRWFSIMVYSPAKDEVVVVAENITERKQAELALQISEKRFADIVAASADWVWEVDATGHYTYVADSVHEILGYTPQEIIGKTPFDLMPPAEAARVSAEFAAIVAQRKQFLDLDNINLHKDGSIRHILTNGVPMFDEKDVLIGYRGVDKDITEKKKSELMLRQLAQAIEQSPESIVITNTEANIEYVNDAFVHNTGYSREEVIGKNPRFLHSGKTPQRTYEELWAQLSAGKSWEGKLYNRRKDGSEYIEHAVIGPIRQPDGSITHYVAVKEDITAKLLADAEIHRLAFYDPLTGLPNRALLLERMTQTLATTRRKGHQSAFLSFNIDRFKNVNDAGGQAMGDELLKAVSESLQHHLREGDVLARIAGDEFGILLTDLAPEKHTAAHHALHVAEKILASLDAPFPLSTEHINVTACLGIVLFPENEADTPLDILRRANTALHHAKSRGLGQSAFFEGMLDEIAKLRFNTERELHQAIAQGELRAFLQVQVDATGKSVGAEALVRWQHPERGLLPPGVFIPIAEESNLIIEIGTWMLSEVCRLLASEALRDSSIRIAVNISPRQFRQHDFVDQVRNILALSGADPMHLTLEVTEGVVIDNLNDVIAKMEELSAMGIHFSMDDFGTGYSSLSYLKRLPIHELKIDKSFIQDVTTDPNDAALVDTILAVAKHLHLKVVAEGVETAEQADYLNHHGEVIHQGYLFHRPVPAAEAVTKLQNLH